jgi:hypothetical protein
MRKILLTLVLILTPAVCFAGNYTVIIDSVFADYRARRAVVVTLPEIICEGGVCRVVPQTAAKVLTAPRREVDVITPRRTVTRTYVAPSRTYYSQPQVYYRIPRVSCYSWGCRVCP